MVFIETEDQSTLRKFARDVAERELAPRAAEWDETEEFPEASWDALKQAGLFGVTVSEDYGGMGMGDVEAAIVLEELGRADVSSAILAQLIFNGPPRAIEHLGNDTLKKKWLPLAASGEGLFCIGITEPDAGSAANLMRSHLTDDGNGGYRLNAYKNYVTGGHKTAACLGWTRFPGGDGAQGGGGRGVDPSAPGGGIARTPKKKGRRGRRRRPELTGSEHRRHPQKNGPAGLHRGRVGLRRRAHRGRRRPPRGESRRRRGLQDAARPPQPRALRQRRHVPGRRPGSP